MRGGGRKRREKEEGEGRRGGKGRRARCVTRVGAGRRRSKAGFGTPGQGC